MQTSQRQIPVRGGPQTNHWRDLLPVYQKELATFDKRLTALRAGSQISEAKPTKLPQVGFTLESGGGAGVYGGQGAEPLLRIGRRRSRRLCRSWMA